MEKIAKEIGTLYETMTARFKGIKEKEAELDQIEDDLLSEKNEIQELIQKLEDEREEVAHVKDILVEQEKAKKLLAESASVAKDLEIEKDLFKQTRKETVEDMAIRSKATADIHNETVATRERLLVEVARVEEMKATYKQEITDQLLNKK